MRKLLKALLILVLVLLCAAGAVAVDDVTVSLEEVDYYAGNLPSSFYGYRILLISDFHDSMYFDQVANLAHAEQPDLVLFLGDMTELSHTGMENTERLLERLSGVAPIYGVLGNHEVLAGPERVEQIEATLTARGMRLLNHEKVTLQRGTESIDLIGVRDVTDSDRQLEGSWLVQTMRDYLTAAVAQDRFTLLAAHRSVLYPYLADLDIDLMLSGHMHGGVIRLPGVGGLIDGSGGFLPDYDKGFYKEGNMEMYVCSGCDLIPAKLRVNNGPSVTLLTLKS